MATPVNRHADAFRPYWYLLLIIATALLAWGWAQPAGGWHIEAPGSAPSQRAIAAAAGAQLQGRGTGVAGSLSSVPMPDPRPAPGG